MRFLNSTYSVINPIEKLKEFGEIFTDENEKTFY